MVLILFGKQHKNYFQTDIGYQIQEELMAFLEKEKWDNIMHQQSKYYYWNDLKYIIPVNKNANHKCKKDKINSYTIYTSSTYDMRICDYQEIVLPLDIFPPITEYNDMRLVSRTVMMKKDYTLELLSITHQNNCITHEIQLHGDYHKMNKIIKFMCKRMKEMDSIIINHRSRFILSCL